MACARLTARPQTATGRAGGIAGGEYQPRRTRDDRTDSDHGWRGDPRIRARPDPDGAREGRTEVRQAVSRFDQYLQGRLQPAQEEGQAEVHQGLPLDHSRGLQGAADAADRVLAIGRLPRLISRRRRAGDTPGATTTMGPAASSAHAGRHQSVALGTSWI